LGGDTATRDTFKAKADGIKKQLQTRLWDPKREFFFPMSMRDEQDKEGHVVKALTLTYESGQFAGNPQATRTDARKPDIYPGSSICRTEVLRAPGSS
jgi:hypothetical protein